MLNLIAQSLERRNELEEERSSLVAYSQEECETQEDLADSAEYLRLLRKDRLTALQMHILASEQRTPMPQTLASTNATPTSNVPFEDSAPYSVEEQNIGEAGDWWGVGHVPVVLGERGVSVSSDNAWIVKFNLKNLGNFNQKLSFCPHPLQNVFNQVHLQRMVQDWFLHHTIRLRHMLRLSYGHVLPSFSWRHDCVLHTNSLSFPTASKKKTGVHGPFCQSK